MMVRFLAMLSCSVTSQLSRMIMVLPAEAAVTASVRDEYRVSPILQAKPA